MRATKRVADMFANGAGNGVRRTAIIGALALWPLSAAAAPYTGTGGGPETTVNAPYRAGTGQTVPPGRDAAPEADPTERTARQKRLDGVLDSICKDCRDAR